MTGGFSISRSLVILVSLPLGGCSVLFPPTWLGGNDGPHHTSGRGGDSPASTSRPRSTGREATTTDREIRFVDFVFDVVRIDLPLADGVRHSRKIWNHVDELRVGSESVARLVRNGLRIGAAGPDAWPAIRAILEAAEADLRRNQLVAQRGMPLMIELATVRDGESIFCYGSDSRLTGKTFAAGRKLLNLDYSFHPELGRCTDLQVGFEVRHDRGVMTWERQEGIIRHVPAIDRYVFSDVSALLTLNSDEFLVIGPSDQAKNEYLIGSRFLTLERSGNPYETVICITPRPFQTRGPAR